MSKGFFNLSFLESSETGDNDIIMDLFEESDKCEGSTKDSSVSVPGGCKEAPAATATQVDAETYNASIKALKQSFKESLDIINVLENANVVDIRNQELKAMQEAYIEDALVAAYENGPLFEAVARSDKDEVKSIVQSIRTKVIDYVTDDLKQKCFKPITFWRHMPNPFTALAEVWNARLWQMVALVMIEESNIKKFEKDLAKEFSSELGEYKLILYRTPANLIDVFRYKFHYKNRLIPHLILVDKKMPSELKAAFDKANTELANVDLSDGNEAPKEDKKEDK